LGCGFRVQGTGFWVLGAGLWVPGIGCSPVARRDMIDTEIDSYHRYKLLQVVTHGKSILLEERLI